MAFWQSKQHEIDFVVGGQDFLEVKGGPSTPLEFSWFAKVFPKAELRVITQSSFQTDTVCSVSLEEFLLERA